MKIRIFVAAILASGWALANASDASASTAPKGTVCFANSLRNTEQIAISCKGLGKFNSIAEIYERGYRIVSSGVLPEAGTGTVFFFIEERK